MENSEYQVLHIRLSNKVMHIAKSTPPMKDLYP